MYKYKKFCVVNNGPGQEDLPPHAVSHWTIAYSLFTSISHRISFPQLKVQGLTSCPLKIWGFVVCHVSGHKCKFSYCRIRLGTSPTRLGHPQLPNLPSTAPPQVVEPPSIKLATDGGGTPNTVRAMKKIRSSCKTFALFSVTHDVTRLDLH